MIYSPDRLLYPMKRVDFDPKGERNPQNRGISGYERISWDEALDIAAGEIQRVKEQYGPGAIMNGSGSHHTWGSAGILAERPHPLFQPARLYARRPQPRQLGRMVLGRGAPLGTKRTQWRRRDLRHGRRPAEELPR